MAEEAEANENHLLCYQCKEDTTFFPKGVHARLQWELDLQQRHAHEHDAHCKYVCPEKTCFAKFSTQRDFGDHRLSCLAKKQNLSLAQLFSRSRLLLKGENLEKQLVCYFVLLFYNYKLS